MNNNDYIQKHSDILSFCELSKGTIATYVSYLRIFLNWLVSELDNKPVTVFSCASDTLVTLCRDKKFMGELP